MTDEVAIEDGDFNPEPLEIVPNTTPTLDVAGLPAPEDAETDALASLPSPLVAPKPIKVPAGDEPVGLPLKVPSAVSPVLEGFGEGATVD